MSKEIRHKVKHLQIRYWQIRNAFLVYTHALRLLPTLWLSPLRWKLPRVHQLTNINGFRRKPIRHSWFIVSTGNFETVDQALCYWQHLIRVLEWDVVSVYSCRNGNCSRCQIRTLNIWNVTWLRLPWVRKGWLATMSTSPRSRRRIVAHTLDRYYLVSVDHLRRLR